MTAPLRRTSAALAGTTITLTLLAACGTGVTAGAAALDDAPATTSAPTIAAAATAPAAAYGADRFGPDGYDGVTLGMSAAQVRATGSTVTDDGADAACDGLGLRGHRLSDGQVSGYVSRRLGAAFITAPGPAATTPEGVHDGSTRAEVRRAYPDARRYPDFWAVAVPDRPGASYWWWYDGDRLTNLSLVLDRQDCAN